MTDEREEVSVRTRFERFPATVKGAFVVRGEDANPHQVSFNVARVVLVSGTAREPIPMKPAVVHVPPHQDVFLPFEFPVTDLGPGWYALEADMDVDGTPRTFGGGKRFVVAWPRATTRRGTIDLDEKLDVEGAGTVLLKQLDCGGDQAAVRFSLEPGGTVDVRLAADGEPVGRLDLEIDEETGLGKVTAYPLMRTNRALRIEVSATERSAEAALDVQLP